MHSDEPRVFIVIIIQFNNTLDTIGLLETAVSLLSRISLKMIMLHQTEWLGTVLYFGKFEAIL